MKWGGNFGYRGKRLRKNDPYWHHIYNPVICLESACAKKAWDEEWNKGVDVFWGVQGIEESYSYDELCAADATHLKITHGESMVTEAVVEKSRLFGCGIMH